MIMWLLHEGGVPSGVTDTYVGSPMYGVIEEHRLALGLVAIGGMALFFLRHRLMPAAYRRFDHPYRLAAWLLVITTLVHLGLLLGHDLDAYTLLYGGGTLMLGGASAAMLTGRRRWRLVTGAALSISLAAYNVAMVAGEVPDQVGLATKLVELTALAIVLTPRRRRTRFRLMAVNGLTVSLFLVVGVSAWIGAFSGSGGHHLGDVPSPGVLVPAGVDRNPTEAERAAHDLFVAEVVRRSAQYADLELAAAAGFDVANVAGDDYHAANERFKEDGHVFDPARPENLIYGIGASGDPVLLGVMFEMPGLRQAGPAVGGPLTVWHAHDHVCLTVTGLGPLVSPWGGCPIGHVAIAMTNEMIHVWTVPGAQEPVGELEDWERAEYLASR